MPSIATTSTRLYVQKRIELAQTPSFQDVVLLSALQVAHDVMNTETSDSNIKLKHKAVELLNNPEGFKSKLALSVAAIIEKDYFLATLAETNAHTMISSAVLDALDAIAGQGI